MITRREFFAGLSAISLVVLLPKPEPTQLDLIRQGIALLKEHDAPMPYRLTGLNGVHCLDHSKSVHEWVHIDLRDLST